MPNRFRLVIACFCAVTAVACTSLPEMPREGSNAADGGGKHGEAGVVEASKDVDSARVSDGGIVDGSEHWVLDTSIAIGAAVDGAGTGLLDSTIVIGTAIGGGATTDGADGADCVVDVAEPDAPTVTDVKDGAPNVDGIDEGGGTDVTSDSRQIDAPIGIDSAADTSCGPRNCKSTRDNNCNGLADNTEPECACPTPNQTLTCSTGQPGICATGSTVCTFAADNTTSGWSPCAAPSPHARDCTSTQDNNCDGHADNTETQQCACPTPGETKSCSTGQPGICATGSTVCTFAADNTTSGWSPCVASSPHARDCRSTQDNNCDGHADNTETQCACPTPGETKSCSTGQSGICATGSAVCSFVADNSSSSWVCTAPSPKTRDCTSTQDNNCDGHPDNSEPDCAECGKPSPRQCQTGGGPSNVGTCRVGTETLVTASDGCHWAACAGAQGPTAGELCGADAPDLNCDGTPGNGDSCTTIVHIYRKSQLYTCSCSGSSANDSYVAGTVSPGNGWTDVSQFKVFTGTRPNNTIPLLNCSDPYFSPGIPYVAVAETCPGASPNPPTWYVSLLQANTYVQLSQIQVSYSCSRSRYIPLGPGANSSLITYFTVP